jgi:hypothetical protein
MTRRYTNTVIGATHSVRSKDGTTISYLSIGGGPSVLVLPGVLSMAADYAAFARALSEHFTVHTIERRGRGESGPQRDDYSIVKECEDVLALQAETGASFLVGIARCWVSSIKICANGVKLPDSTAVMKTTAKSLVTSCSCTAGRATAKPSLWQWSGSRRYSGALKRRNFRGSTTSGSKGQLRERLPKRVAS